MKRHLKLNGRANEIQREKKVLIQKVTPITQSQGTQLRSDARHYSREKQHMTGWDRREGEVGLNAFGGWRQLHTGESHEGN